jgi:hypothetical protein
MSGPIPVFVSIDDSTVVRTDAITGWSYDDLDGETRIYLSGGQTLRLEGNMLDAIAEMLRDAAKLQADR